MKSLLPLLLVLGTHALAFAAIPEGTMSFEAIKPGALGVRETPGGRWVAKPGHAEVTAQFAHRGTQSLHILGGDLRQVEFTPASSDEPRGRLSFRAERWTARVPFAFRMEALEGDKWSEIYQGDKEIRVGARFLSHVSVPVPPKAEKFRLTCSAPAGGGILIDDVRLAPSRTMNVRVRQTWPVNPILIGKSDNPVVHIHCDAEGELDPQTVTAIQISAAESDRMDDIRSVRLFMDGQPFGDRSEPGPAMIFTGERVLREGRNTFVVSFELADEASLDRRVKAKCVSVRSDGKTCTPERARPESGRQRIGIALRRRGQDRCEAYRIPGIATTNKGVLIAVYDNRYRSGGDLPGDIDVGMSRSSDGGQTWEPMKVIMDMGDDPEWKYDGIGDPAVLVDGVTGTIWVAATWSHGNRSWNGSGPGMTLDETGQLMLVKSEDEGVTWASPINITAQIKDPKWRFVLQGPGNGIMLMDGTLVFAAQFRGEDSQPVDSKPFSTLMYSKDRGETWGIGTGVKIDTTEAQLVELADHSIMINCRDNRGGSRAIYTTRDLGRTWEEHPSSRSALPDPVCMASLIRETREDGPLLVFSNPAQSSGRHHLTIKVSDDEGHTWPDKWHTLIDERTSAYSCLTPVGEDRIGLLYEGAGELYFVRVPIKELRGSSVRN